MMGIDPKISGVIGFAAKSGKLLSGTYAVEQGIRQKRAKIVLSAEDVNPKRLSVLRFWCSDMGIPLISVGKKEDYGGLLGKPPLGLLALTDEHMAEGILKALVVRGS
jgi:ribosomal protein L7Ae-like RNA K-turn-binding protein